MGYKMNKYSTKVNKNQLKIIKACWEQFQKLDGEHHKKIYQLEKELEKLTGIKGIEFFQADGSYVGVGNAGRTMKLIQLR